MKRAIDSWHSLCEKYSKPDGLPVWEEAGRWTRDKLYFWKRYIDITTQAMCGPQGQRAFPGGLIYVDLFGGAGVCALKGHPQERFPGSAIIAAHAQKPFRKIIVCEKEPHLAEACHARLQKTSVADRCEVLNGDCNQLISDIVHKLPRGSLALVFIDPKALDAQFSTVETLSQNVRADLVVLFADGYDINRNVEHVYYTDPNSKLDQTLGPNSSWRESLKSLRNSNHITRRKLFADIYKAQLQRLLGYTYFHEKVMCCRNKPLYRLVYASKSELGVKFWREALKQDSEGQRTLF